jgi:hypothetical protein
MNVSDTRSKVEGAEKSSLVTRIADLDETPVLTLVDTSEQSDASEMPDPLIQALVNKLPKPNSVWSNEDHAKCSVLPPSYSISSTSPRPTKSMQRSRNCHPT